MALHLSFMDARLLFEVSAPREDYHIGEQAQSAIGCCRQDLAPQACVDLT